MGRIKTDADVTEVVTVRVPRDLLKQADDLAAMADLERSDILRMMIKAGLKALRNKSATDLRLPVKLKVDDAPRSTQPGETWPSAAESHIEARAETAAEAQKGKSRKASTIN